MAKVIETSLEQLIPEVKGDRRGWKRNIKELKKEIEDLGYNPDEFL